ncbi:hypothetical protein VNO77_27669 [Canavalia gladiata]|uniref:Uncharacterized protein n=1 Tax=Canavalia gladiata TaxID=3824 RepID=A0AAN9KW79_CANGL
MRNETFHLEDKDKVEYYILGLLLWPHRLAIKGKDGSNAGKVSNNARGHKSGLCLCAYATSFLEFPHDVDAYGTTVIVEAIGMDD